MALVLVLLLATGLCGVAGQVTKMMIVPDAGRRMAIGELYDARTHQKVAGSLWAKELINATTVQRRADGALYNFVFADTFRHKAKLMDISLDFGLSFMGGDIEIDGAFRFMKDKKRTAKATRMSMRHNIVTVKETIDPMSDTHIMGMNKDILGKDIATHVVTGVTYGANSIATFETSYESEEERQLIDAFLRLNLLMNETTIGLTLNFTLNETEQSIVDKTQVFINGDIIPPTDRELPTKPDEALKFMRQLHQFSLGAGGRGVALTLELTPLAWVYDTAVRLANEIAQDMMNRIITVYESLDESEELILDLLAMREGPFRAWKRDVEGYYEEFLKFRTGYARELAFAVSQRRNGSIEVSALASVLDRYWASRFSDITVAQTVEQKRDTLLNLLALVKQMKKNGVTMAESYSDFQAPTFNTLYDRVYALIIVGMIPSADRVGIGRVRDFTALAGATRSRVLENKGVKHCVERQPEGRPNPICVENLKFVAIHFDTFCEEFCPFHYCSPAGEPAACPMTPECTVGDGVAEALQCWTRTASCNASDPRQERTPETPLQECFCACPRTVVVEYAKSQNPIEAEHLPVVPGKPAITSVDGADEAELHPLEQRVVLRLNESEPLGYVRNFRVRVMWFEASESNGGHGLVWVQRERIVETRDANYTILITGLRSGERYRFEVAGVNTVGEGPYSVPTADIRVSHNRPMVFPAARFVTNHESVPMNVLPGWRVFNLNGELPVVVGLSTPANENLNEVAFYRPGSLVPMFKCESYSEGTQESIECTVPLKYLDSPITEDTTIVVIVRGKSGDVLAWGNSVFEAPSLRTCGEWEVTRSLLCDLEIKEVIDNAVERGPLHQVVQINLNGSTHDRSLLRYKVRLWWKEAGESSESSQIMDTNTDRRDILVVGLSAGQTYQFQVAGVDMSGNVGPYTARFPASGFKVAYTMPIVSPSNPTHHARTPENVFPVWHYDSSGKLRVTVELSTRADTPIASVEFEPTGRVAIPCTNYNTGTASHITCTLKVGQFPLGVTNGTIRVYDVNSNLLAHAPMELLPSSSDSCYLWEPTKRKYCVLTDVGGITKCVTSCEQCRFNTHETLEFSGVCRVQACATPTTNTFCPDTGECFNSLAITDKGCKAVCSSDTTYYNLKGLCAVPCQLKSVAARANPGETITLKCDNGWVFADGASGINFTCPEDNTDRFETNDMRAAAKWARNLQMPNCRKCDNRADCSGRAASISSNTDRTSCVCQCLPGYTGTLCERCDTGYVMGLDGCWECTTDYCFSHATSATPNTAQTQCVCQCLHGFEGARCDQCSVGFYGDSCRQCTSGSHCNGNAVRVTSNADRSGCLCVECKTGYKGSACDSCDEGYVGYPTCHRPLSIVVAQPKLVVDTGFLFLRP